MFTFFAKHSLFLFADDLPRRRPPQIYKPPTAEMIAYLDFSVSTTGMLTGVKVRHNRFTFKYCCVPSCRKAMQTKTTLYHTANCKEHCQQWAAGSSIFPFMGLFCCVVVYFSYTCIIWLNLNNLLTYLQVQPKKTKNKT